MYKNGYLKVELITPKLEVGNVKYNEAEILTSLNKSKSAITVFPELCITGYSASDLFFQESFIEEALKSFINITKKTTYLGIFILGLPFEVNGVLYNVAGVVENKKIIAIIPKKYLPNSHEFYEKRWFNADRNIKNQTIMIDSKEAIFGNVLFKDESKKICFGIEVCQDLWATITPSDEMSIMGANMIINLSASTEFVGKKNLRKNAVLDHSRKQISAYVYVSSGNYESSSENSFSGHKIVSSMGKLVKESNIFSLETDKLVVDIDFTSINYQRRQDSTYKDVKNDFNYSEYSTINVDIAESNTYKFEDEINKLPFITDVSDFKIANDIQVFSLIKKLDSLSDNYKKLVIGVSGGLDSTLALLVAHQAFLKKKMDTKNIIAVTMPSTVTSSASKKIAVDLMKKLNVTLLDYPIDKDLSVHLETIKHDKLDVTYENAQARIRTLILMNLANKNGGIVLGTGDMSEIALGWMTYNGDQMSMYAINAGVPKTLVRELIKYHINTDYAFIKDILEDTLNAPITPELLKNQNTEDLIGNYEINDFILYQHIANGKDEVQIKWLLEMAFLLSKEEASKYVDRFLNRFYSQQFKRQTLPEGPKVLEISLSPRGEYRLPSDIKRK